MVRVGQQHLDADVAIDIVLARGEQSTLVYRNQRVGRFAALPDPPGPLPPADILLADDLDNNGDVDIVILNAGGLPTLLKNETSSQGHWLQVTLRGTSSNREGIGAQVRVVTPDLTLMDEVHSGRSYQSHFGSRLYFGLGPRTEISRIEVDWIGGEKEVFRSTPVDRHLVLTEGEGIPQ